MNGSNEAALTDAATVQAPRFAALSPPVALAIAVALMLAGDPLLAPIIRTTPGAMRAILWSHSVLITAVLNCVALALGALALGTIVLRGQDGSAK